MIKKLGIEDTKEILKKYLKDSYVKLSEKNRFGKDSKYIYNKIIEELEKMKYNPYSYDDEILDDEVKQIFINYIRRY